MKMWISTVVYNNNKHKTTNMIISYLNKIDIDIYMYSQS